MSKIRVLIVDDAVVVRRMVADMLSSDPALEVAGTAPNGRIALAKITQVNPDVVILDLEMPEMDGLQTVAAIRKTHPPLPVIMFSRFTQRGAAATIDALALGATDYVAMPEDARDAAVVRQCIHEQLIPKIKAFGSRSAEVASASRSAAPAPARLRPPSVLGLRNRQRVEIVAIGTSTGGPNALATLLPALPAECPVPIVIVQHMPPVFTGLLAKRLAAQAAIGVSEGTREEVLHPAHAWIAPGDYHMELVRAAEAVRFRLHQGPPENSCRPSVDVLFRSVAETYGAGTLAVVLTGMGQDGLRGCERIREAGGQILVQDEATSVVCGMPGFVARAKLADQVLPLGQLAPEIIRRVRQGRSLSFHG